MSNNSFATHRYLNFENGTSQIAFDIVTSVDIVTKDEKKLLVTNRSGRHEYKYDITNATRVLFLFPADVECFSLVFYTCKNQNSNVLAVCLIDLPVTVQNVEKAQAMLYDHLDFDHIHRNPDKRLLTEIWFLNQSDWLYKGKSNIQDMPSLTDYFGEEAVAKKQKTMSVYRLVL